MLVLLISLFWLAVSLYISLLKPRSSFTHQGLPSATGRLLLQILQLLISTPILTSLSTSSSVRSILPQSHHDVASTTNHEPLGSSRFGCKSAPTPVCWNQSRGSELTPPQQYEFPDQGSIDSNGNRVASNVWRQVQDPVIYPGVYSATGVDVMSILVSLNFNTTNSTPF